MYNNILLAFDGSSSAEQALQAATAMAVPGTALRVVAVADTPPLPFTAAALLLHYDADHAALAALEKCHTLLDRLAGQLSAQGIAAEMQLIDLTETRDRSVAKAILDEADEAGSDLIVIGSHGRHGARHFLVGSVAEAVVREAPCPVLLVPGKQEPFLACLNPVEIYGQWPEDEKLQREP